MRKVVIVGGARTPNIRFNTLFRDLTAYELGRIALSEALYRSGVRPDKLDEVIFGNVSTPVESINIARIIALLAGVPQSVPAFAVGRNCASGLESVVEAYYRIGVGDADIVAAGGTESMTGIPLIFKRGAQKKFAALSSARSLWRRAGALASFRPSDFAPVSGLVLGLTDFNCQMGMGLTAETLAKEFAIPRIDQDEFALSSHRRAAAAWESGRLGRETVPVPLPPDYGTWVKQDNGIRKDQSMEALSKLRPAFDRRYGTVTAGNSSQITDGASCLILCSEERAWAEGWPPLAAIRGFTIAALDPCRMGLGPAHAIPLLLKKLGMALADVHLVEINEAFAAQVLACERALDSAGWCRETLGMDPPGAPDRARLNVNGGAIALGHPVGASGNRLLLTLAIEMKERNLGAGLASLCVGGGQGVAMMLERS